jgi:hypothetical protein
MTTEERCAAAIAREARRTAGAAVLFAVLWTALGFGLADADVWVAGFPLWAITSTLGVMIVGALIAVYLARASEDIPFETRGEGALR